MFCFVVVVVLSPSDTPRLPARVTACFYACLSHAAKFVSNCACQASTVSHTSTHRVIVHVLAHPHSHLLYSTHTHDAERDELVDWHNLFHWMAYTP